MSRDLLPLSLRLRRGRVPVVDHLQRQDGVEREASNEPVQDELVVHLLQGREDARERAEEVVEHLHEQIR